MQNLGNLTRTACATAVMACWLSPVFASAPSYQWTSGDIPEFQETKVNTYQDQLPSKYYTYLIAKGSASGVLENFRSDIVVNKTSDTSSEPQLSVIDITGNANIDLGGSTLDLSIETDMLGGGNNMIDAIYVNNGSGVATISADKTTIDVKSTNKNGKSVYGIAVSGGSLHLTGSEVNINLETNTDRDNTNYSEALGLDVAGGETYGSSQTTLNIVINSTGETETGKFEDTGKSGFDGNWWGASPATAVKLEGGNLNFEGIINADITTNAANATGVSVLNYFANTSHGEVWNDAAGKINELNVKVKSQSGRAAGISVEYVPDESSEITDVILSVNGESNITAETDSGNAYGILIDGKTTVDINENTQIVATSNTDGKAYSASVTEGSLSFNGSNNSFLGDFLLTNKADVTFADGVSEIDGNISSEGESNINLVNSTINLVGSHTITAENVNSNNGSIILNTAGVDTVSIDSLVGDQLNVIASAGLGNNFSSVEEAAEAIQNSLNIGNSDQTETELSFSGEESDVLGAWFVDEDGKVIAKENTKLASMKGLNAAALVAWRDEVAYTNQRMEFLRDNSHAYGAWAQVYGGESKYEDKAELTTTTVQVGADMTIGDWVAGAAFSYMTGEADLLRGDADTDAYTLSLYAERNFDSGLFVNGLARYGRLSTDATAGNMDASYDNNAFSLGGNVGYRFTFAEQAFVEPNFGLQYAYVMGDDYKASNGVKVEQDDFDALIASLGARIGFNFPNNAGKLFARASVNHDFLGEIDGTAGNGKAVQDMYVDLGGTWVTYGVGTQFNITDNLSVWGNVDRTTGGEVSTNYMMNAGLRYVF